MSSSLLATLLREVSRSFYLTLRILPGTVRPQISLAYLLARASDTIADTELVSLDTRLQALQRLRERILGLQPKPLDLGELVRAQGAPDPARAPSGSRAERTLLERIEEILALLGHFSLDDQQRIRDVLRIITSGQELDLRRFAGGSVDRIVALPTEPELDDYTYRVAGCVGEFWTKLCRAYLFPKARLDDAFLLSQGVRFGQGLQLVNILRDLPSDLRQGRCYLPADKLTAHGLAPMDLLRPESEPKFRPLYQSFLDKAGAHLAAGWDYTNALPRRCVRVRLACAWPILIGAETLGRLRVSRVLDPAQRIKINRAEVRAVMVRSILCYPWPAAWRRLFARVGILKREA